MADKLIGADALTRAIVNSPSDISGYNPVYCNGVAKRQLEILDIVLNMNGTTEGEIRAKAIDDFAERLKLKYPYFVEDVGFVEANKMLHSAIDEITEEMRGAE